MKDFNEISFLIEDQFPAVYKEDGPLMVQFVKAYYEYVDEKLSTNRDVASNIDIDHTSEEFIKFFKDTYLSDFPFISATDARFLIKHIIDYYRTKGTIESTKLLIRLLFGEESDVYMPSADVFKPSDSNWFVPRYVEVTRSNRTVSFLNKQVVGSRSGAKAIVEGLVTKRVNGKYVDVIYLSDIQGFFIAGDRITDGGSTKNAPIVIGSLNSIRVTNGGRDNNVGDIFDVIGSSGRRAKARVKSTFDETGRVDFELVQGGSGYTTTDRTDVYVSDAVLTIDNPLFEFIRFEQVIQKMEDLQLLSVADIEEQMEPGRYLVGINENGVQVANGTIIDLGFREDNSNLVADVKMLMHSGTFDRQERIRFTANAAFLPGEIAEEESTTIVTLQSPQGTFSVGDRVEQALQVNYDTFTADLVLPSSAEVFLLRETVVQFNANNELAASAQVINRVGNVLKVRNIRSFAEPGTFVPGVDLIGTETSVEVNVDAVNFSDDTKLFTSFAYGFVQSINANTNVMVLEPSWGIFEPGLAVTAYANTDTASTVELGSSAVSTVNISEVGARGRVSTQVDANTIIVENIFGQFTVGKEIRGSTTRRVAEISTISNEGATDVWLDGNTSANGVIDLIANTTAIGVVIDQNSSAIGVHGNTVPFFSSGQVSIEGSLREVSTMVAQSNNNVRVLTDSDHNFQVGDNVLLEINLQQNNEVKSIDGIFQVQAVPAANAVRLNFSDAQWQIVNQGNYAFFFTSIQKTLLVPIVTDRAKLISPPRNANGEIIEVNRNVRFVSEGQDAGFRIGSLENEETVFLATDIIGSNNTIGVPYLGIQINAANSGVGFVDSLIIDDGGTSYSNNQILTFEGGGYAGGQPLVPAQAGIMTNAAGTIIDIQVISHGQGYWNTPTIVWPGGNTSANVEVIMDYGYGFPKSPNGDLDTILEDLWTLEPFTIGTITSLSSINPGRNYNQDPFVLVYNRYVAGFRRTDFLLTFSNLSGSFRVGETLTETIPGDGGDVNIAKGFVLVAAGNQAIVRRTSFNTAFTSGYDIVGDQTGATAVVLRAETIEGAFVMGDNAIVNGTVIAAEGIAAELEIIDSGFGYENNEAVSLERTGFPFIMTGTARANNQGVGSGFWKTKSSHLNSNAKLHDNRYFQEFSYDVITGKSLNKYQPILRKILHVAGTRMFGTVEARSRQSVEYKSDSKFEIITD